MSGKTLVIVESPGKITKIGKILGPKYVVAASVGHIIDLPPKEMGISINNKFKPVYKVISGKNKVITNIKNNYKNCSDIILATDEDREGEMIAWSIAHVLKLDDPKRIVFNSITKTDIMKAISKPGHIDMNMVDAQKSRRISDRLVGFELSPLVNKYLSSYKLSAGRVQSVVVKIIIERENDIKEHYKSNQASYFKIKAEFKKDSHILSGVLYDSNDIVSKITDSDKIRDMFDIYKDTVFSIRSIDNKISKRNPPPPFTTSTLQQEANKKCGFTSKVTMMAAQKLYEAGHITYMRTDSVNLSTEALGAIKKYVISEYGNNYYKKNVYKNKGASQEAHEAIRPTYPNKKNIKKQGKIGDREIRLYDMIWKRTIASQMKPAEYSVNSIVIDIKDDSEHYFLSKIEVLLFLGYLKVYGVELPEKSDSDKNKMIKTGDKVDPMYIEAKTEYNKQPAFYNEASLINKLSPKNLDIGRPSTYASIISKILERGYVEKTDVDGNEYDVSILRLEDKIITEKKDTIIMGSYKNVFISTNMGRMVNEFLDKNFKDIMDYKFTARMEDDLDKIASGKLLWYDMLDKFYKSFHPIVEKLGKMKISIKDKYEKVIGKDPATGDDIIAYVGKYGPVLMKKGSKSKAVYAPIKDPLTIENISLEQALEIFKYPKKLGVYKRKNVVIKKGKYGFYIEYGKAKLALEKEVTLDEAKILIDKRGPLNEINDDQYKYRILTGQYGKYISVTPKKKGSKSFNISLPDDIDISSINKDNIQDIINKYRKKRNYKRNYKKT